jgi:hypothetical protein
MTSGGRGGKRRGEIGEKRHSDQPRLLTPRLALYISTEEPGEAPQWDVSADVTGSVSP